MERKHTKSTTDIEKGSIWWVNMEDFTGDDKLRPVLVISNNIFNKSSKTVMGFILSRSRKIENKFHYKVQMDDGVSGVNVSNIYTIPSHKFVYKHQDIPTADFEKVFDLFCDVIINGE